MSPADRQTPWVPNAATRLAFLRADVMQLGHESAQVKVMEPPAECYLGVEGSGACWIGFRCDPSTVATDDSAAAIEFRVRPDGYRVILAATVAEEVASHFFDAVLELLASGFPVGEVAAKALADWRELLARPPGAPLSDEALVGLFGELEVLEMVLRHGGSLEQWTGWRRDHCDFRMPGLVLEIKSTTSANYRRVKIHGLGQLADPVDGSELVLVLRRLESSPDGRNVPDLVNDLVRLGASRSRLLDHLQEVHYSEAHRARYLDKRFVSKEVALRQIDSNHPRLVPEMLADVDLSAIDKIDYELNLNGTQAADLEVGLEALIMGRLSQ